MSDTKDRNYKVFGSLLSKVSRLRKRKDEQKILLAITGHNRYD
jgi:hypothetical protein